MSGPKTHYQVLEVSANARQSVIHQAYLRLSLEFHPDKNPGLKERAAAMMKNQFQIINEAHRVLGDPASREKYDAELVRKRKAAEEAAQPKPKAPRRVPSENLYVKLFVGDVYDSAEMALLGSTDLLKNGKIDLVGSFCYSPGMQPASLVEALNKDMGLAIACTGTATTSALFFASNVGSKTRKTLVPLAPMSRTIAASLNTIVLNLHQFKRSEITKATDELGVFVFRTAGVSAAQPSGSSDETHQSTSSNASRHTSATAPTTFKVNVIFGGILYNNTYYVDQKASQSAGAVSVYIRDPLVLTAPGSFCDVEAAVSKLATVLEKTYNNETHVLVKVFGDIVNIAKPPKVRNMRLCARDDTCLATATFAAGVALTVAVLPRDLTDSAISFVGGSKVNASIDRQTIIAGLKFAIVGSLLTGKQLPYLSSLRFTDSDAKTRGEVVDVFLRDVATSLGGEVTRDRMIAAITTWPRHSLPRGLVYRQPGLGDTAAAIATGGASSRTASAGTHSLSAKEVLRAAPGAPGEGRMHVRDHRKPEEVIVTDWPALKNVLTTKESRAEVELLMELQVQRAGLLMASRLDWVGIERLSTDNDCIIVRKNLNDPTVREKKSHLLFTTEVEESPEEVMLPSPPDM